MMASSSGQLCLQYALIEIQAVTENFHPRFVTGRGSFGKVYKARIRNGEGGTTNVAIKRWDPRSGQGAPEFRAEIETLSKLRQSHLVSLLGFCDDVKEKILVYEYIPNGTLHHHLHKSKTPLSWMQRLWISIGAARGLEYLHTGAGTKHGVIHRDIKSSNVLLDNNYSVKISDFGLAKTGPINQPCTYIATGIKGTFGYLDPEFFLTGKLTRKTDVFSFGVLLFELLSGRHAVFPEEDSCLERWAQNCVKSRKLDEIVEDEIKRDLCPKILKEFAQNAYCCLHSDPKERPTMSEVVVALQRSESLQEKFDNSAQPLGINGVTWKIQKYSHLSSDVQGIKKFSYADLKLATRNFQTSITGSGRVRVTKGWVHTKTYAPSKLDVGLAISVAEMGTSAHWDLQLLGKFSHPSLVRLLGYCLQDKSLYLVHEFMEKNSLKDHLYKGAAAKLSFRVRIKIAVGVARGLNFLQSKRLIIRKWTFITHDICLDEEFNVKLQDFDVAVLIHRFNREDSLTYYSTAAGSWWQKLCLCDVNGLGKLLMEILTGQPINAKQEMKFLQKKYLCGEVAKMSNKMIEDVVDQRIKLNASQIESTRKLLSLILKCTSDDTMEEALNEFEEIYSRLAEM